MFQARMADAASILVDGRAKLEVLLLLREELTLGRVCDVLEAIFKSLEEYNAKQVGRELDLPWAQTYYSRKENCWFFVSILYELLVPSGSGLTVFGKVAWLELAPQLRPVDRK